MSCTSAVLVSCALLLPLLLPLSTGFSQDSTTAGGIKVVRSRCTLIDKVDKQPWFRRRRRGPSGDWDLTFEYDYNRLDLLSGIKEVGKKHPLFLLLIHPIGVGIGRWYYDRLLNAMSMSSSTTGDVQLDRDVTIVVPDLLACGTASNPLLEQGDGTNKTSLLKKPPLLTVPDWSAQVLQLMESIESNMTTASSPVDWCILSNGGCVPIALETSRAILTGKEHKDNARHRLTNVILSATPRLSGLLRASPRNVPYQRVSGWPGQVFWWYALRNKGRFIQKFSERNLAADPANLGDNWTPTCVETGKTYPSSRYSTFMFLAGALQMDCRGCFDVLNSHPEVRVDVISGDDKRKNPARSWFWERKRRRAMAMEQSEPPKRVSQYLKENGNRGDELFVGGRRCPAHEDATGFASALWSLLGQKTKQ